MLEGLFDWFRGFGLGFTLLGLFLILVIDATVFPALPELFAVLAFLMDPTWEWGAAILMTACLAEIVGNSLLYGLVKWKKLPGAIERIMSKWTEFILLGDERIILLNRIAPVMPFTGAFMAVCRWDYKKCMIYLVIGGLVKYSALLALVGFFNYQFDPDTAQMFSIVMVLAVVCVSIAASYFYRKGHVTQKD